MMKKLSRHLVQILTLSITGLIFLSCSSATTPPIPPPETDAFVGAWTWNTDSNLKTASCGAASNQTIPASGDIAVTKTGESEIQVVFNLQGLACDFKMNVAGDTASIQSGQTCTLANAMVSGVAVSGSATFTTLTTTLSSDKQSLTANGSATGTIMAAIITINDCIVNLTGTLAKKP